MGIAEPSLSRAVADAVAGQSVAQRDAAGPRLHADVGLRRREHHHRTLRRHGWWGGYDEDYQTPYIQDMYAFLAGLDIGPRYPDTVQNLQLINVIQPAFESTTRLRLVRRLSAPDYKQDVP